MTAADVLPGQLEHRFTPPDFNPEDFAQIEPLLERLAAMPTDTRDELEVFLRAWNEVDSFVAEAGSQLRLDKARRTNDEALTERWMHYVREVAPQFAPWQDRLGRKLLASPAVEQLRTTAYGPFVARVETEVKLFREENIALERDLHELSAKYGEISGGWMVEFEGEERTLPAMQRFLLSADRDVRRRAWEAISRRRFEDADALDALWDEMFERRHRIARNAGFENFRDYIFVQMRRDYDPQACFAFHELVEAEVLPLVHEIYEWQKERLGLERMRPWDTSADPDGREPLAPFGTADELIEGVGRMMKRLDPELGRQFEALGPYLDLDSRPHKEQGGFMMTLPASNRPFIFANASGRHSDVITLLHEAGHAFHMIAAVEATPMSAVEPPIEFCEVASMAMELLHRDTLDEFYGPEERARAVHEHLRRIPTLLASVARGDAFQHWLYTHPEHTAKERRAKWLEIKRRFTPHIDDEGLPGEWLETDWHQVLHFFLVPFYYIEYGFAQLGALQVALAAEHDRGSALARYKQALALGPQRDTPGLFEAAGVRFVPTREQVRELMQWIREQLFA